MMTGIIKLEKKSSHTHTHTLLIVDVESDYVKAASTAECDRLVQGDFITQSGDIK